MFFLLNKHAYLKDKINHLRRLPETEPIERSHAITPLDFDFPINQAEEDGEEDYELPEELARLVEHEDKMIQAHQEPVDVINLGTEEDQKQVKVGTALVEEIKN